MSNYIYTSLVRKTLMGAAFATTALLASCGGDEPGVVQLEVPSTYSFEREGVSTVSYAGQTSRLDQLAEIKAYLQQGDEGGAISADALKAMFANTDGNGGGHFSQAYSKDIRSKTYEPDRAYFEGLMDAAAAASELGAQGQQAAAGQAGLLQRGNGNTMLVNENGHEFTQIIEKGVMGACFYYQICEVYLTDSRIGDGVENDELEEGSNYTAMEHHWDEAFGYFGVPIAFPANKDGSRFWGNYANGRDALLGANALLMNAFLTGRTAIVNKEPAVRDAQRDVIYEELEKVCAATAIHYINSALEATNDGDRLHVLSEARAFAKALKYNSRRKVTLDQINAIVETHIGTNLWEVTVAGLNEAKSQLSAIYGFDSIKDTL